ncbi:MAG: Rho termination factor N-terminal domain-containing protein [Cellulomonas sp.]|nr:Rho termination factor N-terminal domain-containing protein [Cellulomonas sp.]
MPGRMRDPGPLARGRVPAGGRRDPVRATASDPAPADPPIADETWSMADLRSRAAELGIEGRSSMNKAELIEALRRP